MGAIFIRVMAMPEVSDAVIRFNQDQMYVDGIDSKGASLGEYAPSTKMAKDRIGAESDHITLYDQGDFYKSMELIEKGSDSVVISADMQKQGIAPVGAISETPTLESETAIFKAKLMKEAGLSE